jgi:hypothetical protein
VARALVAFIVGFVVSGLIALLVFLWPYTPRFSGTVFKDGIGIYLFNNNQYSILVWKKKLIGPRGVEEKDIMEASQQATVVQKGVRFFSYGLDISRWPVVPPYLMAFCIARDAKTIDGIFPIRIKPVDQIQNIYELILPPQIDNLAAGTMSNLFWTINFQNSCNDGWVFKFQ